MKYKEQLIRLTGDTGARNILDRSGADTFFFMTSDLGVVKDIDVRSDLFGSDSSMR
jgi:CTP:molybdopterin cytidylyltransferase MocA